MQMCPSQTELVAEAIHVVAVIEGGNGRRRVSELARVRGVDKNDRFVVNRLAETGEWV